jgi:predicted ribosome quality control (RQC) complex YloA/Tae2 family protein
MDTAPPTVLNFAPVFHLPDAAFLTQTPPAFGEHPSSFIMRMRKLLGGRPTGISQVGFDRIIRMDFSRASVVVELFADGNLLLLDEQGVILSAWRSEEFSSRKLRSGYAYLAPPMEKCHPTEFQVHHLDALSGFLVSSLSKVVNLSPMYLEEACLRAGVDKKTPVGSLSISQKSKLKTALASLLEGFRPGYYPASDTAPLAVPFPLMGREGFVPTASFSEALALAFAQNQAVRPVLPDVGAKKKAFVKEQQKEAILSFEEKEAAVRKKGEWLLANSELVEKLRQHSDASEETLRELAPGLKFKKKKYVLELDVDE